MSSLFPRLDSLVGLSAHGVDVKPTLLRVLTDLYVQKPTHSPDEERQYVELALRLIDAVDPATRAVVARRLAEYPAAPAAIVARLEGRARPVVPTPTAAPRDAVGGDVDARATTDAFFAGDERTRLRILCDLDTPELLDADAAIAPSGDLVRQLERSALAGRPGDFVRALEHALGVSRKLAERIVNDAGGEPLVIAARALAIPVDGLQRILLFVNPAISHSVQRIYALTALADRTSLAAVLRLVACWREADAPSVDAPSAPAQTVRPAARARGESPLAHRPRGLPGRRTGDMHSPDHTIQKVAS